MKDIKSNPKYTPSINATNNEKAFSSLGSNIRTYRQMKKLTQQKLGELLGFSARTVSDWECNNTEPDIKTNKLL